MTLNGRPSPTGGAHEAVSGPPRSCNTRSKKGQLAGAVGTARERFLAGEDAVEGVRPAILSSWSRCRDYFHVDSSLDRAPFTGDVQAPTQSSTGDVVVAGLAEVAAHVSTEVASLEAAVVVTDGSGRVLGTWGDRKAVTKARDCNLAPLGDWTEGGAGTNGMGTALEGGRGTIVRKAEHWCEGFRDWTCVAVPLSDPVTDAVLGVINISSTTRELPDDLLALLHGAVANIETELRHLAVNSVRDLVACFAQQSRRTPPAVGVADVGGRLVRVTEEGARLFGVSLADFGSAESLRAMAPRSPELKMVLQEAIKRGRSDHGWASSMRVFLPAINDEIGLLLRPVISQERVVGVTLSVGDEDSVKTRVVPTADQPSITRLVGFQGSRMVLLRPAEIHLAEADEGLVWFQADDGRYRAAYRGLGTIEQRLQAEGFVRVHRRYIVNLNRVREIVPAFKGSFWLLLDAPGERIPVSRRHAAEVRRALAI